MCSGDSYEHTNHAMQVYYFLDFRLKYLYFLFYFLNNTRLRAIYQEKSNLMKKQDKQFGKPELQSTNSIKNIGWG